MVILDEQLKNVRTAELDEGKPTVSRGVTARGEEDIYVFPNPIKRDDPVAISNTVPVAEDALVVKKAGLTDTIIGFMRTPPQNGLADLATERRIGSIELLGETYRVKIKEANAAIVGGDKVALVEDSGNIVFDKDSEGTSKVLSLHHRTEADNRNEIEVIFPPAFDSINEETEEETEVVTPPATRTVAVTVEDSTETGIEGAAVVLTDKTNATKTYTGTTGSAGGCNITNVPEGKYSVTATATGYKEYNSATDFTVSAESTSISITMTSSE